MVGACADQEIGKAHLRVADSGRATLPPVIGTGLHDKVPWRKILQTFSERLSTVERLRDLCGVTRRQLEERFECLPKESQSSFLPGTGPGIGWR